MATETKVALVTGAGRGIGKAIALRLARDGFDVSLVDLRKDELDGVAAEIKALGRNATAFVADISDRATVYKLIDDTEQALGGLMS